MYIFLEYIAGKKLASDATPITRPDRNGPESANESEDGETASQIRRRYLQSGLDEVSDPQYWQELANQNQMKATMQNIDFKLSMECMTFVGVFCETSWTTDTRCVYEYRETIWTTVQTTLWYNDRI